VADQLTRVEDSMTCTDEAWLSTRSDADLQAVIALRRRARNQAEANFLRAKYQHEAAIDEAEHRRRARRT
jgi:hypothetical protein